MLGNNVTKFNNQVQLHVDTLGTRGESSMDMLVNLFKGYMVLSNKDFLRCMQHKLKAHQEGSSLDYKDLMVFANNKCKIMKEAGMWNAPSS